MVGLPSGDKIADTYQALLDLQARRDTLQLITGKRVYDNMLMKRSTVTTDVDPKTH